MRLYLVKSVTHRDQYIFASGDDDAASIYVNHRVAMGEEPPEFTLDRRDRKRPWKSDRNLKLALARNIAGIGERDHRDGWWAILDEEAAVVAARLHGAREAAQSPRMTYGVTTLITGDELVIFAKTTARVSAINIRFMTLLGELPDPWSGKEWTDFQTRGNRAQLDAVLNAGAEGLGLYDLERGWSISPLPDELQDYD